MLDQYLETIFTICHIHTSKNKVLFKNSLIRSNICPYIDFIYVFRLIISCFSIKNSLFWLKNVTCEYWNFEFVLLFNRYEKDEAIASNEGTEKE
jgi:hypothetical protein